MQVCAALAAVICGLVACSDEGLDGPKRQEFDAVDLAEVVVQRGDVAVFGSDNTDAVVLDRWISKPEDFEVLEERRAGRELVVEAICDGERRCEVRYDMGLAPDTDVDVTIERGELRLSRMRRDIDARVGSGRIDGYSLQAEWARLELQDGDARVAFDSPPDDLRVVLGHEATMTVLVPDRRYRCHFDEKADAIAADELDCHDSAGHRLRVEPPDAKARFVVQ